MHKILHISNTDISSDFRIIRQLSSLSSYKLYSIGVADKNQIHNIDLSKICTSYIVCKLQFLNSFHVLNHFFNFLFFNFSSFKLLRQVKPDLIHVHDTYPLVSCVVFKLFYNCKVIYDCHELESRKISQNKLLCKFTYFIEFLFYKYCDCLITVSSAIENWYVDSLGRLSHHLILYNSPQTNSDSYQGLICSKCSGDKKRFVYVGQFSDGRNILELLEVFKNSHHECFFVGWGAYENEIKECASNYNNIFYKPPVPNNDLIKFLSTHSFDFGLCLLSPVSLSDELSLPNKIFEYAFSGINVISNDFPEISAFVKDVNAGYIVNDISDFSVKLLNNEFHSKVIDQNSLKKYSFNNMSVLLCDLYLKILK